MFVNPLTAPVPDEAPATPAAADVGLFAGFISGFDAAGSALQSAERSERAFESGRGGLQEMVFERARADAILSVASAGASKATQALSTILNMQV